MGRALYSLLLWLLVPFALWIESKGAVPGRLAERFGRTRVRASQCLWIHAVSMGEVQAAAPLVRALLARYPERTVVVSTTTATGAQRVRELFADRVQHAYLPLDLPFAVLRFLDAIQPDVAIMLETELWPNLYAHCAKRGVPILVASARLSARSVGRYRTLNRLFGGLVTATLAHARMAAQSTLDRDRFIAIGAAPERVVVAGNLKFDVQMAESVSGEGLQLRSQLGAHRFIWVAGSTHEGEESVLLEAHARLREQRRDALLVMVPRHPQRFDAVAADLDARAVPYVRRSRNVMPSAEHAVVLVDTMGELQRFYAAGRVAYVGGTLIPLGGHNLLEPAALGLPVLCGPHTFNAPDIAQQLLEAGALSVVHDAASLASALIELMTNEPRREQMGRSGREVIEANRGACARLVEMAAELIKK